MTSPLPHFGSGGDLPLIITKNNNIFFIIKRDGFQAKIKGKLKMQIIEPEFLKEGPFRNKNSFQKNFRNLIIPKRQSSSKIIDR